MITIFTGVEMAVFGQSLLKCQKKKWHSDNCKVSRIAFAASFGEMQIEQYTKAGGWELLLARCEADFGGNG